MPKYSRLVILPYKPGSRSARLLANELTQRLGAKVRRVRPNGRYKPRDRSIIINYGLNNLPQEREWYRGLWCNNNAKNTNKLTAFGLFKEAGIPTPEWTESREVAQQWINEKKRVVCRTLLNAHSGRGIFMAGDGRPIVICPLYVLYKKKRREFRVHVFNGSVIDVSQKRRRNNVEDGGYIRNLANGWVFCRDSIVEPPDLRQIAVAAVKALGLNFGACDIIWNEKENKCYVLEVNTAPGLEGTTLQRYTEAITNWVRNG
ncbi:MAG: hypothetical protein NUV80_06590 [Candidatus Berkelbacteria bacterium]|nr:hypothetical protein [Candidatus Berkelbacteria bacterium]